ncbi:hypothetical protein ES707_22060 [subsurface metagenome]|jgi:predicted nuclease with RNAse H fold
MRVVGIDLTGSQERRSGVACLDDERRVLTARLKSDLDIENFILDTTPNLVSIDSPLSLPENPKKIYRDCELELKRRGIGVYWCLLPSMKALTMRGISLANRLRKKDIAVIESYPGAAQDILNIPRKSKGVEKLASALAEYGIVGNLDVTHDELDAITAAIVGILYLRGEYEALGCLIIPKVK